MNIFAEFLVNDDHEESPFFLFTTEISSDDIRDVFLLFTTCRIAFILPAGVQQIVCDNHQSVSQQRAQFTRSRRSIPDGERCATDLSLARQLYSTIFTLQAGTIGPGCPSGTDKINHTATLYTLNFSQWSLPIMELSVYKGTCQLINPSPGMVTGQTLHGDTTFWNLLDRMS